MPNPKGINQYSKGGGAGRSTKKGTISLSTVRKRATAANKAAGSAWDKRQTADYKAKDAARYRQIRINNKRRATLAAKKK